MENGSATSPKGGDGAHHNDFPNGDVKPEGSSRPASSGHKRSLSGSILSKLAFLRTSFEEPVPTLPSLSPKADQELRKSKSAEHDATPTTKRGGAMAFALSADKVRKRKGSLRKAAMLGTGKLHERRNSRSSDAPRKSPPRSSRTSTDNQRDLVASPTSSTEDVRPPRRFSYENPSAASSAESGITLPLTSKLSLDGTADDTADDTPPPDSQNPARAPTRPMLASPVALSAPTPAYVSTTDDSDSSPYPHQPPSSATTSSSPSAGAVPASTTTALLPPRRRSKHTPSTVRHTSPLSQPSLLAAATTAAFEEDAISHSYTETERYGWLILVCTWLIFVVGMGSCLGVWSWAWDVGETPYAPPELEDDPTLPVVGYYPALIVMTGVMAWVWVVAAWVGMKYFRHAKVVGEEG